MILWDYWSSYVVFQRWSYLELERKSIFFSLFQTQGDFQFRKSSIVFFTNRSRKIDRNWSDK